MGFTDLLQTVRVKGIAMKVLGNRLTEMAKTADQFDHFLNNFQDETY